MGYFIKRLDDNIINISLIQSVTIVDSTHILWTMKNGQTFLEEYTSVDTATARLNSIKSTLLSSGGSSNKELLKKIDELTTTVNTLTSSLKSAQQSVDLINGEVI